MDEINPSELFGQSPVSEGRPGSDCPEDQILTAALDGEYQIIERPAFEEHVAGCDYCLARLGRFARVKREAASTEISDLTMMRAQRLITPRPVRRRAPVWAAAAMVGIATILSTVWLARTPTSPPAARSLTPEVRNIDPDGYRPRVMIPGEGASVVPGGATFEWSAVPGALHYDVRVVSADGTLIWEELVQNPEWRLPDTLHLAAGEDYYFHVDAYVSQAQRLSSRHVMFRIGKDE